MFNFLIISGSIDRSISLNQELEVAVKKGNLVKVTALLNQGADPNYKTVKGDSLLILSVKTQRSKTKPKVVKALLEKYAKINFQDSQGNTAAHIAVQYKRPTILQTLLTACPDPFIKNNHRETTCDLVNIQYPASNDDHSIRAMLSMYKTNRQKQAQTERIATTCLIKESDKCNTGIFSTIQDLLDTQKYSTK